MQTPAWQHAYHAHAEQLQGQPAPEAFHLPPSAPEVLYLPPSAPEVLCLPPSAHQQLLHKGHNRRSGHSD